MGQDQRVAVVAGGSAGAGRAVVSRLVEKGYRVGVLARGRERLEELEQLYGDRVYCLSCDVADAPAVARAGATIEEVLGPVDVWVNMAILTSFSAVSMSDGSRGIFSSSIVAATLLRRSVNGTRTSPCSLMERPATAGAGFVDGKGPASTITVGPPYTVSPICAAANAPGHQRLHLASSDPSELIREDPIDHRRPRCSLPALDTAEQFGWCAQPAQQS